MYFIYSSQFQRTVRHLTCIVRAMLLYVHMQRPNGPLGTGSPGPPSGYIHHDDVGLNVLSCRTDVLRTHLLSTKHLECDSEVKEAPRGA